MRALLYSLLLVAFCPLPGRAAEGSALSLETGIGFTSSPDTFLLTVEMPIRIAPAVDLGPLLQLGVSDRRTIVAPTLNARYSFDLTRWVTSSREIFERLRPIAHGGLGFAYMHQDGRPGSDDDTGFLINFGFGAEYDVADRISVGSRMTFNLLPGDVLGENFFFSWQVATAHFRF
jgi:hypothetical protein